MLEYKEIDEIAEEVMDDLVEVQKKAAIVGEMQKIVMARLKSAEDRLASILEDVN